MADKKTRDYSAETVDALNKLLIAVRAARAALPVDNGTEPVFVKNAASTLAHAEGCLLNDIARAI